MQPDDHAEELASDLGVDTQEVRRKLENLLEYDVPIEEARQSVRREYDGGGGGGSDEPARTDLAEVTTDDGRVTVTAVVLTVGKRSIRQNGERQVIYEGTLADESGTRSYTAWEEFDLSPGETVTVANATVREWDGEPQINLGASTTVAREDETLEIDGRPGGDRELIDLAAGDRGVNVEVRVVEVERRTIDGRDGETDIYSGVLGDETARLPFTDWETHDGLEAGRSVRIDDAFVREYRGVPELNLGEFTAVEPLDREVAVSETGTRMGVGAAVATGGVYDVELEGTVVAVREGSGLVERCPECGRTLENGECRSHGPVEGEDDLRTKAILDDGTGTVTVVLDDDLTADVYGGGLEDAREAARDAMDREVVAEAIRERIVGRAFRVRGHLSVDDFGANLEAADFDPLEADPADRAGAVLSEVSG